MCKLIKRQNDRNALSPSPQPAPSPSSTPTQIRGEATRKLFMDPPSIGRPAGA